jgi:SOS response regulatory protein OraA/RecX
MQIFITSIAASGNDDIAVSLEIREGEQIQRERFVVSAEVYASLGISKGECDRELYDLLEGEARICAAYKRALYILGYGSCSMRAMVSKLVAKGFDKTDASVAVERLESRGLLVEESNARREAERCAAKLWGETRIASHLRSKGYSGESVKDALFALEDNGVDFEANCLKLVESKCHGGALPSERSELQKLIASVMRYGYSSGEVKHALSQIANRKSSIYD